MGVVVYTCGTCGRKKMFVRNEKGVEHIGRCNITLACRGKLTQTEVFESYQRGDISKPVEGIDDWYARNILHNHNQSIDAKEWLVDHRFGTDPAVVVYVDDSYGSSEKIEIIPDEIEILSPDTLKIKFNKPYSGIAQLIARQSHPNLFNPIPDKPEKENLESVITVEGIFTIATKMSSVKVPSDGSVSLIRLRMIFTSENDDPYTVEYEIDDTPIFPSPWNDYNRVSIKGQIYTVRGFNFYHSQMGRNGLIKPGAYAYIPTIQVDAGDGKWKTIEKEEVIILLANNPYKSVDKDRFNYIDAFDSIENSTSIVYSNGTLYCLPDIIKNIHPPIQKA